MISIVFGEEAKYSFIDWRQSQDGRGTVSRDDIEKAILAMPRGQCQSVTEAIRQCLEELSPLTQSLAAKMGQENAPGMTGLRQALEECGQLAQQILSRKGGAETPGEETAGPGGEGSVRAGAASSRTEVYRQLAQAAAVLQQLEPHSPIPYLIQRAVQLGSLPFPQLIKALIREPNVLAELTREFGLGEESTGETTSS